MTVMACAGSAYLPGDPGGAKSDVSGLDVREAWVAAHPEVGAVLLECTNMPPYAADIAAATGRPVFSIYTYLRWFQASLSPPAFINP